MVVVVVVVLDGYVERVGMDMGKQYCLTCARDACSCLIFVMIIY